MARLTLEAKEAVIKKALSRDAQTIEQIAQENGIGLSTLSKWLQKKRAGLPIESRCRQSVESQENPSRLKHVLATANLEETAIGAYCRAHGIYSFQLTQWQEELMSGSSDKKKSNQNNDEIKVLRAENKRLKQDLRRKETALAESSALLILKKKADLIWGDHEDD